MKVTLATILTLSAMGLGVGFTSQVAMAAEEINSGKSFWAYRRPVKKAPPLIKNPSWAYTDIDRFIAAAAERHGLTFEPDASQTVLLRRIHYDLIGLPPTPNEIEQFLADDNPAVASRLIDRLMARPQFGERWGRHWLDVVRYAESVTLRGLIFPEAWRYRDYVIDAFNADIPYDRFVREQIAGDLLPADDLAARQRQLVATTFLALGNWNLEEQDKAQLRMDVVDEQLDTLGKAFLAQTLGCARCHDHKFDPIPTRDYYAMAGILRSSRTLIDANVSTWVERPLPLEDAREAEFRTREAAMASLQTQIKSLKERLAKAVLADTPVPAAILATHDLPGVVVDDTQAKRVGDWRLSQFSRHYIGEGYLEDRNDGKGTKTLAFQPELPKAGKYEVRLAYVTGGNRARKVPVTILSAEGENSLVVDQQVPPPIDNRFVSLGQYRFEQNGQGFVLVSNEGTTGHVTADAVQFIPVELPEVATPALDPAKGAKADSPESKRAREELKRLEAELKTLANAGPSRPMVMAVRDEDVGDTYVHVRGSVHNRGPVVPRGFLQVATAPGQASPVPTNQSGRVQMAEWLASHSNPLTARVMVNRVWHWLFGAGLVRTTDNFGATGDAPSHPELLDFLAIRFMEQRWSTKWLIREIMLSHTYQLSSSLAPNSGDPENRWFTRMNRRALEAECLRDTILAVSGRLSLTQGGPTIRKGTSSDYGYVYQEPRRSVYVPVLRNALPDIFTLFDFADPSVVTGTRDAAVVAPQALFLLNDSFVLEHARAAARQALAWPDVSPEARLRRSCLLSLGREPNSAERAIAESILANTGPGSETELEQWTAWFHALFASIDFRYLH